MDNGSLFFEAMLQPWRRNIATTVTYAVSCLMNVSPSSKICLAWCSFFARDIPPGAARRTVLGENEPRVAALDDCRRNRPAWPRRTHRDDGLCKYRFCAPLRD